MSQKDNSNPFVPSPCAFLLMSPLLVLLHFFTTTYISGQQFSTSPSIFESKNQTSHKSKSKPYVQTSKRQNVEKSEVLSLAPATCQNVKTPKNKNAKRSERQNIKTPKRQNNFTTRSHNSAKRVDGIAMP